MSRPARRSRSWIRSPKTSSSSPASLKIRVGESVQIGSDVDDFAGWPRHQPTSARSPLRCPTWSSIMPDSNALLGVAPGVSTVTFSAGDKMATMRVEVLSEQVPADGQLVIEPAAVTLAPGQSEAMRVFVVAPDGSRIDSTPLAKLEQFGSGESQDHRRAGLRAGAGRGEITATLPDGKHTATAHVTVNERGDHLACRRARPVGHGGRR